MKTCEDVEHFWSNVIFFVKAAGKYCSEPDQQARVVSLSKKMIELAADYRACETVSALALTMMHVSALMELPQEPLRETGIEL